MLTPDTELFIQGKYNNFSIVIITGWFSPIIAYEELPPKQLGITYQSGRPKSNPLLLTKLSKITKTCAIYPYNFMVNKKMDWNQTAKHIKKILDKNKIKPPYCFMGHSFGFLISQVFCQMYREYVNSLISIDGMFRYPKNLLHKYTVLQPNDNDTKKLKSFKSKLIKKYDQVPKTNEFTKKVIVYSIINTGYEGSNVRDKKTIEYFKKLLKLNKKNKMVILKKRDHFIFVTTPSVVMEAIKYVVKN